MNSSFSMFSKKIVFVFLISSLFYGCMDKEDTEMIKSLNSKVSTVFLNKYGDIEKVNFNIETKKNITDSVEKKILEANIYLKKTEFFKKISFDKNETIDLLMNFIILM